MQSRDASADALEGCGVDVVVSEQLTRTDPVVDELVHHRVTVVVASEKRGRRRVCGRIGHVDRIVERHTSDVPVRRAQSGHAFDEHGVRALEGDLAADVAAEQGFDLSDLIDISAQLRDHVRDRGEELLLLPPEHGFCHDGTSLRYSDRQRGLSGPKGVLPQSAQRSANVRPALRATASIS